MLATDAVDAFLNPSRMNNLFIIRRTDRMLRWNAACLFLGRSVNVVSTATVSPRLIKNWRIPLALVAFLFPNLFLSNLVAADYEVDGQLTYAVGNSAGELKTNCFLSFHMWVNGCKWFIRTEYAIPGDIKYNEDSYDGTNVYAVSAFVDAKVMPGSVRCSGIVESNNVPQESSWYASPLWLAFASSCYFNESTSGMLQPIWHLSDLSLRNSRYSVRGDWIHRQAAPFLPEKVLYYNDGSMRYKDKNGDSHIAHYDAPYNSGFLEAEYVASDFTNCGRITLPTSFVFTRYRPQNGGQTREHLEKACVYYCAITSANVGIVRLQFAPILLPPAYIDDRRVGVLPISVFSIYYQVTNESWPSLDNPVLSKAYQEKAAVVRSAKPSRPRSKFAVLGLFTIPTLIFAAIIFAGRKKDRKNTKQTG